jgi:hypothetical protein
MSARRRSSDELSGLRRKYDERCLSESQGASAIGLVLDGLVHQRRRPLIKTCSSWSVCWQIKLRVCETK